MSRSTNFEPGWLERSLVRSSHAHRRSSLNRLEDPLDHAFAHLEDLLDALVGIAAGPTAGGLSVVRGLFREEALEVYKRLRHDGTTGRDVAVAAGLV
jgi:hypothetical protein